MCYSCWDNYGKSIIDTPAVREAAAAVHEVYVYSCAGGNLHIVLDDWNVEGGNLAFCQEKISEGGYEGCTAEQLAVEQRCLDIFKKLTEEERASALALADGYWEPEGVPIDNPAQS